MIRHLRRDFDLHSALDFNRFDWWRTGGQSDRDPWPSAAFTEKVRAALLPQQTAEEAESALTATRR